MTRHIHVSRERIILELIDIRKTLEQLFNDVDTQLMNRPHDGAAKAFLSVARQGVDGALDCLEDK